MKIWGDVPKVPGVYGSTNKIDKPSKTNTVASKKDELTLSGEARDFAAVMKALKSVPNVRQDKADAISSKIESGAYSVTSKDIAAKIPDMILGKKI